MMKLLKRIKSDSFLKLLCVALIVCSAFASILYAYNLPTVMAGEIDSYLLPTISLQYRGSLSVSETDLAYAQRDYPDFYTGVDSYEKLHGSKPIIGKDGQWHYFYFPIYSASILPVKLLLQFIGQNQSKAPVITNALLWMIALTFVFVRLKRSNAIKLITLLLLIFNPIVHYVHWQSAEVLIFSLVVMGLTCFANDELHGSALFISIAGMLNPTIMGFGIFIIVYYFYLLWKREEGSFRRIIRRIWRIIGFGACFVPSLIPFIYYHFTIGKLSATAGMSTTVDWASRILSYVFDLNLGYFPRFPLLLLLLFVFSAIGILKKNVKSACYFGGLLTTVFAFSLAVHIQSGMTGMARYCVWSASVIIFFCTTQIPMLFSKPDLTKVDTLNTKTKTKKMWNVICPRRIVSAVLAISLMINIGWLAIDKSSIGETRYTFFSPLAIYVMDHYPQMYNPFFIVFASRTLHRDGGLVRYLNHPVIYYTKQGIARKILIPPGTADSVRTMLTGTTEALEYLDKKLSQIKNSDKMQYINIKPSDNIELYEYDGIDHIYPLEDEGKIYSYQGFYPDEGEFCWLKGYAVIALDLSSELNKGLEFRFSVPGYLFVDDNEQQVTVQLYVDGNLLAENEYMQSDPYGKMFIPMENLPKKRPGQASIIAIHTSKEFDTADVFPGSGISRVLALQLRYLGSVYE